MDKIEQFNNNMIKTKNQLRWETASNYDELLEANLDFIHGVLLEIPHKCNNLNMLACECFEILDELTRYGILIVNGQNKEQYQDYINNVEYLCDIKRRGYLEFHINLATFVDVENNNVVDKFIDKIKEIQHTHVSLNMNDLTIDTKINSIDEFVCVTFYRKHMKNKKLNLHYDTLESIHQNDVSSFYWNFGENCTIYGPNMLLKNTLRITIIMGDFDCDMIEQLLVDICKTIHVKKRELKHYTCSENNFDLCWAGVHDYNDLLSVNLDFIHGILPESPYHGGPLDNPSQQLINDLDKLHRYGLLTVNGQGSECSYGKKSCHPNGRFSDNEQRGYLEFHIHIDSFVDTNGNNVVDKFIDKIKETSLVYRIFNIKTNATENNIRGRSYNVTRYRINNNKKKLVTMPWFNYTNIHPNNDDFFWFSCDNEQYHTYSPNRILKNTINILLALPEYGKDNLESIVIGICKCIDLKQHDLKMYHLENCNKNITESHNSDDNSDDDSDSSENEIEAHWSNVKSYDELLNCNLDFVHGVSEIAPYEYDAIINYSSSDEFIAKMDRLHRYGILMIDTQFSSCIYGGKMTDNDHDPLNCFNEKSDFYCDEECRGYIAFHIDNDNFIDMNGLNVVDKFIEKIKKLGIYYTIFNVNASITESNIPKCINRVRSRTYSQSQIENLPLVPWVNGINMYPHQQPSRIFWSRIDTDDIDVTYAPNIILNNTLWFGLATKEYGEGSLEDTLINVCEDINLKKHNLKNYEETEENNWSNVETYEELLEKNLEFVHGLTSETPYSYGPLDEPSQILINNLDTLHRFGLLTVNGQESKIIKKTNKYMDSLCDIEQRGYLEFYINPEMFVDFEENNVVNKFIDAIKQTYLIYVICYISNNVTETNIDIFYSQYNVTRLRKCEYSQEEINNRSLDFDDDDLWIEYTNIFPDKMAKDCLWMDNDITYAPNKILKNTINITLAMPEYGEDILENIVIDICNKINLKKHNFEFYYKNIDNKIIYINELTYVNLENEREFPWVNVKKYDDLLNCNLDFVHEKIEIAPYRYRPLVDYPSKSFIKNIDVLHRYGLLIIYAQRPLCLYNKIMIDDDTRFDEELYYSKNVFKLNYMCDKEYRGYLEFHIDIDTFVDANGNNIVDKFIDKIKLMDIYYAILNMKTSIIDSNMSNKYLNVMRFRKYLQKDFPETIEWMNVHNLCSNQEAFRFHWERFNFDGKNKCTTYAPNTLLKNTLLISLATLEYGKGSLEKDIIDLCKYIGLKLHNLKSKK